MKSDFQDASVLLVDDRQENLLALRATLESLSCRLVAVQSGEAAWAALEKQEFAVILLDLMMPGVDGLETATHIKRASHAAHVPILFLTAADIPSSAAKAYAAGAVDFIQKPYDPFALRSKVAVFLELYMRGKRLRSQEEQRLREELARERAEFERANLERLLMDAPAAICIFEGPDHVCAFINAASRRLLGERTVIGKPLCDILPDIAAKMQQNLEEVYAAGGSVVEQEVALTADWDHSGALVERSFNFLYAPRRDAAGVVTGVVLFGFEVTEPVKARKTMERLAAEREKALRVRDEFLSIASHELKTPLTPLKLHIQGLQHGTSDSQRTLHQLPAKLEVMARQVNRLETLVHRLLDISRMSSGGIRLECEQVNLAQLVRDAAERLEIEADRSGTPIQIEAPEAVIGWWDRMRLDHVVTNLLTNAVKFGRAKPIQVRVEELDDSAVLVVRDYGIGIAQQDRERIFVRFERGVSSRQYGGFGVGLWIAREVVDAMGGRINVDSEVGRGSTFRVELPILKEAPLRAEGGRAPS